MVFYCILDSQIRKKCTDKQMLVCIAKTKLSLALSQLKLGPVQEEIG
jgi:hypothetical protein